MALIPKSTPKAISKDCSTIIHKLLNGKVSFKSINEGIQTMLDFPEQPHDDIPVGEVVHYSGELCNIRAGYKLCDGTNDTPDLSAKFVLESFDFASKQKVTLNRNNFTEFSMKHRVILKLMRYANV